MFLIGLLAALLGSCAIGVGQTLQKHAVNRLSHAAPPSLPSPTIGLPRGSTRRAKVAGPQRSQVSARWKDRIWLCGIGLCYLGEICGNWVALSFASAAIVTPMGIVSVIIAAVLSQRYLGEVITAKQRNGYLLVALGVVIILLAAPKNGGDELGSTPSQVLEALSRASVAFAIAGLLQSYVMFRILVRGQETIPLYVAACAIFGAVTVACGRILSVMARVGASSVHAAHQAESDPLGNHTTLQDSIESLAVDGQKGGAVGYGLGVLIFMLIGSVVGQEFFKQQALGRFPVSRFQPVLYAGFNG
ncbi:magnesium transporter NIPA-domain-containing protein, partial [Blyttiomyces helicus]